MKKYLFPLLLLLGSCATNLPSDYPPLTEQTWFINAAVLEGKQVLFYSIPAEWKGKIYFREFDNCCFVDIFYSGQLMGTVSSRGEKKYLITADKKKAIIIRNDEIGTILTKKESFSRDFFEGVWENNFGRIFQRKKVPNDNWVCIMVFPGEAYSSVKPGSYILKESAPGILESYDPFSLGKVTVDMSDPLRIRIYPEKGNDDYEFLYDPVRLWKAAE